MRSGYFFALAVLAVGGLACGRAENPVTEPTTKFATLAQGTSVPLILLDMLEAGQAKEGQFVALVVATDVKDAGGESVIPKGTPVEGQVTWSRSEGTLSSLANQPARLAITVKGLIAPSGQEVALSVDPENSGAAFQFTRENTTPFAPNASVRDALAKPENQKLLKQLSDMFAGQSVGSLSFDVDTALQSLAESSGLQATRDFAKGGKGKFDELSQAIHDLRKPGNAPLSLLANTTLLTSVVELAGLVNQAGDQIGGMLKGRTIRAYPGTQVPAFLSRETSLAIKVNP